MKSLYFSPLALLTHLLFLEEEEEEEEEEQYRLLQFEELINNTWIFLFETPRQIRLNSYRPPPKRFTPLPPSFWPQSFYLTALYIT
jgi:hypothetical protein